MLYCVLLQGGGSDPPPQPQGDLLPDTGQVALQSPRFFNGFAALDLPALQSIRGAQGPSLAFRHIASSLLGHCSQVPCESLLHEAMVRVGYFTVSHQTTRSSSSPPPPHGAAAAGPAALPVLQRPGLLRVLFPVLTAACHNNPQNEAAREQEMSCALLAAFTQDFAQTQGQEDHRPHQPRGKCLGSQDSLELANRFPQQAWGKA